MSTPANWYTDPEEPTRLRYFDGERWTEHTSPTPSADSGHPQAHAPAQDPAGGAHVPGGGPVANPAPTPPGAAMAGIAASSLFSPENREQETTGRMTRQNPAVVKVTLGAPLLVTRGAMIAYQGPITFARQGSGAARFLKGAVGGEGVRLMRCEGQGEVFVAHRNMRLHLLELAEGERVSASSRSLLGFDASISWDIEMIKGGVGALVAGGLFNVSLAGPGTVILASDWPMVLDTSEATTCVDPNAVVAWSAGLSINVRSTLTAGSLIGRGSGEAFQLEFSPGGWVIVEPESPTFGGTGT